MKIKSLNILNDGMKESGAEQLWDKIEMFAAYSFNKSHSVEYSILSYWTMWLKVRYPEEFFAAALSIAKEDKLPGLVKDARDHGIDVYPPDINLSSAIFEIQGEKVIVAPFNSIKGISENITGHILIARGKAGGNTFKDKAHFLSLVNKTKCNIKAQTAMDLVGTFANVEPSQLPARHPDRLREQMDKLPGLIIETIKAERNIDLKDKFIAAKLMAVVSEIKSCTGCDLAEGVHPMPRLGRNAKFMVVADCPSNEEEREGELLKGKGGDFLKHALKNNGLTAGDMYYTTLVKSPKSDKFLSNGQINACTGYIKREIELLKPPVIVALGSAAQRYFAPGMKGGAIEHAGKVIYVPELDASLVCGINPMQCFFDPSKQNILDDIFAKVAEMVLT